jgi:hypothetical protein
VEGIVFEIRGEGRGKRSTKAVRREEGSTDLIVVQLFLLVGILARTLLGIKV